MGAPKLYPAPAAKPQVFNYDDYRAYLREAFAYEKIGGLSYRKFSALAGFKSPNFLKLVIEGQRNLTIASLRKIVKAFRLNEDEAAFLKNLVFMNQASTMKERGDFAEKLYRSKIFRELRPLEPRQFDYYRKWYHIPIRELIGSSAFVEDPKWIAKQLRGKVSPTEVQAAIENLLALGLVERNSEGRLTAAQPHVTTGNEPVSAAISGAVAEFHREMMRLAAESIDETPRHRRELSSSTLLLSEESFTKLKEMVQEFRRALLTQASTEGKDLRVYQMSFLLFPLTENESEKAKGEAA